MFIPINSMTEIAAYGQAGLLWDSVYGYSSKEWDGPLPVVLGNEDTLATLLARAGHVDWRFYISVED